MGLSPSRRIACDAGAVAARAGAHRRRPRLSGGQQKLVRLESLAGTPTLYHLNVLPNAPFLAIPQTSSERREYVPMGWLEPPVIANPSVKLIVLEEATLADFALLNSAMHMAWMRAVTGRLKSRLQLFPRPRLQYLPDAAGGRRSLETGTARPCRSRRPRGAPRRDAGRPLRPGPHAAESAPGASGSRPRRGCALPPHRLRLRARARGAPLRPVRKNARAA